ncbi:Vgb family protein [Herbiconiux daphne]|uniref:Virginiamycin B lyase n=1 Tax=Herbiconiux daphne TaxID=2970914 RepID=A0ABT2GX58_9MICO|nr:hypothetical protein [Herbiconiux daphne]MCS5732549.1 hypothetical protein [Herbiconiux daphne]
MSVLPASPLRRRVGTALVAALAVALMAPAVVVATSAPATALDLFPRDFATWHETEAATAGGRPETLTSDADGFVWYYDGLSNQLVRVDPVGGGQLPFDLGPAHPGVIDLTMGPDGDIWFGDAANSAIGRLDPRTGSVDSFALGGAWDMAFSLVTGPDGDIWFGEPSAGGLGHIAADGTISRVPDPDGAVITNLVSAPDGRLWYTRPGLSSLGAYDPAAGTFDLMPLALIDVSGVALGRDGTLWVGGTGALANITLAGAVTIVPIPAAPFGAISPASLVAGEASALYFTDNAGAIGEIDSAGTLSFVRPPFAGAMPNRLAVSGTGSLWYTDFTRGTLGWV